MVLSLVTPTGPNFIKDFPAANTVNCNRIDSYAGPCLITNAMQSYTPLLTAPSNNPILGSGGFIRGYYYQIFDQIYSWGEFRYGTGLDTGLGVYTITLPFNVDNILGNNGSIGLAPVVGEGAIWHSSAANRFPLTVHLRSINTIIFGYKMGVGSPDRELTNNDLVTFAAGDGVSWFARFKRLS
jgi:hypothetical protein